MLKQDKNEQPNNKIEEAQRRLYAAQQGIRRGNVTFEVMNELSAAVENLVDAYSRNNDLETAQATPR